MARLGVVLLVAFLLASVLPARAADKSGKFSGVKKYVLMNLLLATADYESAHAVQHRGGCWESNPAFSRYPSRGRFYAEGLAIDAGPELVGWLLHRKHVRFWQLPFAVVATWHGEGIVTNLECTAR